MKAILDEMLAALSRGERVVLSSILASSGSVPRGAGAKMAVLKTVACSARSAAVRWSV